MYQEAMPAGGRRNAEQIIARVARWNFSFSISGALTLFLVAIFMPTTWHLPAIACGILVVSFFSFLSILQIFFLNKFFSQYSVISAFSSYLIKLGILVPVLLLVRNYFFSELSFFLLGLVGAILMSLIISSLLILCEEGPDFDFSALD